jgi:hypothetical protein
MHCHRLIVIQRISLGKNIGITSHNHFLSSLVFLMTRRREVQRIYGNSTRRWIQSDLALRCKSLDLLERVANSVPRQSSVELCPSRDNLFIVQLSFAQCPSIEPK